jgi:hypothetical protein
MEKEGKWVKILDGWEFVVGKRKEENKLLHKKLTEAKEERLGLREDD